MQPTVPCTLPGHHLVPLFLQAAEGQLAGLKQAADEAVSELALERKKGAVKERKLMDRTHEASKLREQLQEVETAHQVTACLDTQLVSLQEIESSHQVTAVHDTLLISLHRLHCAHNIASRSNLGRLSTLSVV